MQRVVQKWKDPLNGIRLTTDILFNPHLNIFFRDREKEREREREQQGTAASRACPEQGSNPQARSVP